MWYTKPRFVTDYTSMQSRLRERWESFTKEQRLSVILLAICGFFALGLSAYQMNMNVHAPFLADKAQAIAFKQSLLPSPDEQDAKQKRTDTDGDGLSDWDEINVYHLNPNLKDTCGDGMLDNIRVATGKNLVCSGVGNVAGNIDTSSLNAATSTLSNVVGASNGSDSIVSGAMQAAATAGTLTDSTTGATTTSSGASTIPRDPQAIRAALKGQVDQASLDALTDQQLLQYYDQAVADQNATSTGTGTSTTGTSL